MKTRALTPVFGEYIPAELEPRMLYISMQFETAVHLCACGCGSKVVTPLGPHDWVLTFDGTVTLDPSLGNGQQGCRSHYFIRNNQIDWRRRISTAATVAASTRDRAAHATSADRSHEVPAPWWRKAKTLVQRLSNPS
jgi:Family of unknown function (DUF6527)